jgi:hypothetical protein
MTAQIPDRVRYKGESYALVGIKGSRLLSPQNFGMTPTMIHTACYRGYYAEYSCTDGKLVLTTLTVKTANDKYKEINGIRPVRDPQEFSTAHTYTGLNIATAFSGGLLIAKDFIQEMYVHMGFQKPLAFKTVIELLFENGQLVNEIDYSEKMVQIRESVKEQPRIAARRISETEIMEHIEHMFSLNYWSYDEGWDIKTDSTKKRLSPPQSSVERRADKK